MKRWLYLLGFLAVVGIFARLPHPAKDIAKLTPVRAVYLYREENLLNMETDTGDFGRGRNLPEAYKDMRSGADGEIFLDTAEFLILDPRIPITEDFYEIFRPGCKVTFSQGRPDLNAVPDYLAVHTPELTLAKIRAG